jgi:hypothetical protein
MPGCWTTRLRRNCSLDPVPRIWRTPGATAPPGVVPIGVFWNGQELVIGTATDSPKTKFLTTGAKVAVSIEANATPPKVLLIRGTVRVDTVDGIAPEYAAMIRTAEGEERGQALLEQWAAQAQPPRT